MRYDVTGLCPGFGFNDVLRTGLHTSGDEAELILKKDAGFYEWINDEMSLADGRTVGQANRETMHRLLDAWLDGVEFKA
jgi:hypothetical protein